MISLKVTRVFFFDQLVEFYLKVSFIKRATMSSFWTERRPVCSVFRTMDLHGGRVQPGNPEFAFWVGRHICYGCSIQPKNSGNLNTLKCRVVDIQQQYLRIVFPRMRNRNSFPPTIPRLCACDKENVLNAIISIVNLILNQFGSCDSY